MMKETVWNNFILENAPRSGAFLQMWEWGNFQESVGKNVQRILENGLAMQLIENKLPLGQSYLYCPRGPIGQIDASMINDLAKTSMFLRLEPPVESFKLGRNVGIVQPADTLITDLSISSDELLAAMHSKTRYNIRLSEKKGVTIEINPTDVSFTDVWQVFKTTGSRGAFVLHSEKYYQTMINELSSDDCNAYLAIAKHDGDVLAANIMIDCAGTRTYLHGASSNTKRNMMAPYLLHWKLIQDAQDKGLSGYDWWGIAPEGQLNHKWAGVTRFKLGFGGDRVSYAGAFDVVGDFKKYWAYQIARKLLKR